MKYSLFLLFCWALIPKSAEADSTKVFYKTTATCPDILNLPDTLTGCTGSLLSLSPSLSPAGHLELKDTTWSPATGLSNPNGTNTVVTVGTAPQIYTLTVLALDTQNLVLNGDFEQGNTGFTSGYVIGSGGVYGPLSAAGQYVVINNAFSAHNLFTSFNDHTSGAGQMMVVNGASAPNVSVWCQTITVLPNTLYDFSTWIATAYPQSPAVLQFSINGNLLGNPFTAFSTPGVWGQFHTTWFSGSSTSATICITNQNTALSGNDFALDDIAFREACFARDSVYIRPVNIQAAIDTAVTRTCNGDTVRFTALASGTQNASYYWQFGDGTTSTQNNPQHVYQIPGTYVIKLFVTANGCTDSAMIQYVSSPVITQAGFQSSPDTACIGQPVQFISNGSGPSPLNYFWVFGDGQNGTGPSAVHSYSSPGPFTVTHIVNATGCSDTTEQTIYIREPYRDSVAAEICAGATLPFGSQNLTAAGTYKHTFTATDGCDSSVVLTLEVNPLPQVGFSFDTALNEPVVFKNTSILAVSYYWDFGDGNSSVEENPQHQYKTSGSYRVCLTATSAEGCKSTYCRMIPAEVLIALDVPEAFTPNGDGTNDVLYVRGGGVIELNFRIYNRWGQMVFQSSSLKHGWDGYYRGKKQEMEVMAYILEAVFVDGSTIQKQGNISILP